MRSLFLLVALAACGSAESPQPATTTPHSVGNVAPAGAPKPHTLLATIERTACYGTCPIYKLAIYADGALEYDGEEFVKTKGHATGKIDAAKVDELDRVFAKAGYLAMKDYVDYEMTDAPSTNTSYHGQGKDKAVKHYHGDSHAPAALGELEEAIDRIANIEQFIGTEKERESLRGR